MKTVQLNSTSFTQGNVAFNVHLAKHTLVLEFNLYQASYHVKGYGIIVNEGFVLTLVVGIRNIL